MTNSSHRAYRSLGVGMLPAAIVRSASFSRKCVRGKCDRGRCAGSAAAPQPLPRESKRIFGIIPNNRTSPSLKDYKPLSSKQKFEIARQDSFDRGTVVLAAAFAG